LRGTIRIERLPDGTFTLTASGTYTVFFDDCSDTVTRSFDATGELANDSGVDRIDWRGTSNLSKTTTCLTPLRPSGPKESRDSSYIVNGNTLTGAVPLPYEPHRPRSRVVTRIRDHRARRRHDRADLTARWRVVDLPSRPYPTRREMWS
jgi:hypothetical protein